MLFRSKDRPVSSTLRTPQTSAAAMPSWLPASRATGGEALKLRSTSTPGKRALGCLLVTLFWNGIVSIFIFGVVQDFLEGDAPWFPALFISIFALVGLAMILSLIYFTMTLFNPKATLTVATDSVALGGPLDVAWDVVGAAHRITRLHIYLEGIERATYRQGTSTRTEDKHFARIDLADVTDPAQVLAGAGTLTIPADSMHSLEMANNKLIWQLHVKGEIRRWPDVDEEYPIVVLPRAVATPGAAEGGSEVAI